MGYAQASLIENSQKFLCKYGCGQIAKYQFVNGDLCCSKSHKQCPVNKEKTSIQTKGKKLPDLIFIENIEGFLCKFGCGKIAKYQFTNGNLCCSNHVNKCPVNKRKISESGTGREMTIEQKLHLSIKHTGKIIKQESIKKGIETAKRNGKGRKYLADYKLDPKNNLLFKEEEIIEDPITKKLMGHCKYSECKNSKENGGFFELKRQFEARKFSFDYGSGNNSYFYCSADCKEKCDLFNVKSDPNRESRSCVTQKDYDTFREWVLEKDNHKCFFCGKEATKVHHEVPQIIDPGQILDPPNGVSFCVDCHDKYGHKTGTECSTGNLGMGRYKFLENKI